MTKKREKKRHSRKLFWFFWAATIFCCLNVLRFHYKTSSSWTLWQQDGKLSQWYNQLENNAPIDTADPKYNPPYAYAYLIAGCDPNRLFYLGYICNIIVAARILRLAGSTSDIIVMVRMGSWVDDEALPDEHQQMLESAGIIVKYLPKSYSDNFYTAQMDKFQILDLVEYRRVLYMDSDVVPFCNLDYFFELSDGPNAILRENIILAYNNEPAHGGLFMLTPNHEDFLELTEILHKHYEEEAVFDEHIGWGHTITYPDEWKALKDVFGGQKIGQKWDFYAAFADQGLLYYWTKYRKRNVSILGAEIAESWSNNSVLGENDEVISVEINEGLHMTSTDAHLKYQCSPFSGPYNFAPFSDFKHAQKIKPWMQPIPEVLITNLNEIENDADMWYFILREEVKRLSLPIDVNEMKTLGDAVLGGKPKSSMAKSASREHLMYLNHLKELENVSNWAKMGLDTVQCNAAKGSSLENISPYAYAFLIAGCDPAKPAYLGYICNIIVSAKILRCDGSTNDIIVMVRMGSWVDDEVLPKEHQQMLESAGIIVKYLPETSVDNFYTAQMDKFRILDLVEYRRVIYMDSDVVPFCNLDYFFDLSDGPNAVLEENIVVAYSHEPAHGGLFMLTPNHEDFLELTEIIHNHYREGAVFDEETGWGHTITHPDVWKSLARRSQSRGTRWDFYGAFADQGLLYYWTKYRKKKVSILNSNGAETWSNSSIYGDNGEIISVQINEGLHFTSTPAHLERRCSPFPYEKDFGATDSAPYADFKHFTGNKKPWREEDPPVDISHPSVAQSATSLWYHILRNEVRRLGLPIDVENLRSLGRATLGLYPRYAMASDAAKNLVGDAGR